MPDITRCANGHPWDRAADPHCPACHATTMTDEQTIDPATGSLRKPVSSATLDPRRETRTLPPGDEPTGPGAPAPKVAGYEILGELGRGGMGVVYRARQLGLNRIVALKMILAGGHAGPQALARFKAEAEAVAQLQHPNIVQIYEIGEWQPDPASPPLPYFSLECVDGGSLAARLDGTPLPPRDAAQLVQTLAHAMHAAHEKGIVHRDLKPANVLLVPGSLVPGGLVSEDTPFNTRHQAPGYQTPVPKITDFGLAKQVRGGSGEAAQLTATGAVLGTPSYMAPEQADGRTEDIGPRTDVYALGAILYELLTGRPPFKAATPLDTIMQVVMEEPVPPSSLLGRRACPRDVETICLKAMAKEPGRRYQTAHALADDLHRFLDGEPIEARPVGRVEKAWRWCRRNPVVAGLSAALVLVLVGGLVSMTLLYLNADAQRARAEHAETNWKQAAADALSEEEKAREAESDAKASAEKAKRAAAESKAVLGFFQNKVLAAARPKGQLGGLGPEATIRAALDAAGPGIAKAFADQPEVEAAIRNTLAETYVYMGVYPEGESQCRAVLELCRRSLGSDNPYAVQALGNLAVAMQFQHKLPEAEALNRQALEVAPNVLGATHRDVFDMRNNLAATVLLQGRLQEAEALMRANVEDTRRALGPDHEHTLTATNDLGYALMKQGKLAETELLIRQSNEGFRRKLGPEHPHTLMTSSTLAMILHWQGKSVEAEELLRKVVEIRRRVSGPDHADTLGNMCQLGGVLVRTNRLAEAEQLLRETIGKQRKVLVANHPHLGNSIANLGNLLVETGRAAEAEPLLREVLVIYKDLPKSDKSRATADGSLGHCLVALGRYEEAEPLLLASHEGLQRAPDALPRQRREAVERLVKLYDAWGKPSEAERWFAQLPADQKLQASVQRHYAWPILWGWPRF